MAGHSSFVVKLTVDGLYEYVSERGPSAPQIAYLRDRDYVVVDKEVVIVDEFTGRMMPGSAVAGRAAPGHPGQGKAGR